MGSFTYSQNKEAPCVQGASGIVVGCAKLLAPSWFAEVHILRVGKRTSTGTNCPAD